MFMLEHCLGPCLAEPRLVPVPSESLLEYTVCLSDSEYLDSVMFQNLLVCSAWGLEFVWAIHEKKKNTATT